MLSRKFSIYISCQFNFSISIVGTTAINSISMNQLQFQNLSFYTNFISIAMALQLQLTCVGSNFGARGHFAFGSSLHILKLKIIILQHSCLIFYFINFKLVFNVAIGWVFKFKLSYSIPNCKFLYQFYFNCSLIFQFNSSLETYNLHSTIQPLQTFTI